MAKARMLHKSISLSIQVNQLPLEARLLFSWLITHADDEGRLKGEPEYIKGSVVPLTKWSHKRVKNLLETIQKQGLIHYWQINGSNFIEFIKWNDFQQIRKDRFSKSSLPSFYDNNDNHLPTNSQPENDNSEPQSNEVELNKNKIELSQNKEEIADNNSSSERNSWQPENFIPSNEGETAAKYAHENLEPNSRWALRSTYLKAYKDGLPANKFYQFVSEIKQDSTILNSGAVFNKKAQDYFLSAGLEQALENQDNDA